MSEELTTAPPAAPTAPQGGASPSKPPPPPMGKWEGLTHLAGIIASLVLGVIALLCKPQQPRLGEYALLAVVLLGGLKLADVLAARRSNGATTGLIGPLAMITFASLLLLL